MTEEETIKEINKMTEEDKLTEEFHTYLIKADKYILELLQESIKLKFKSHSLIWSAIGASLFTKGGYDNSETIAKILIMFMESRFKEELKQM